eukprot:gene8982-6305_t
MASPRTISETILLCYCSSVVLSSSLFCICPCVAAPIVSGQFFSHTRSRGEQGKDTTINMRGMGNCMYQNKAKLKLLGAHIYIYTSNYLLGGSASQRSTVSAERDGNTAFLRATNNIELTFSINFYYFTTMQLKRIPDLG